jgi:hypothetical protein
MADEQRPGAEENHALAREAWLAINECREKLAPHSSERLQRLLEAGILSTPAMFAARRLLSERQLPGRRARQ